MSTIDLLSAEFQARFQQAPTPKLDDQQLARWQQLCRETLEERDKLRLELADVKRDRDILRKSLIELLKRDVPFTKEEVLAARAAGPSLEQLIQQFES